MIVASLVVVLTLLASSVVLMRVVLNQNNELKVKIKTLQEELSRYRVETDDVSFVDEE